jgi:hypothetical protein
MNSRELANCGGGSVSVVRAWHVCEHCLVHEDDTFWGCQVDHIISRKHDGATEPDNLASACAPCNQAKGSDLRTRVGKPPRLIPLFHPRIDRRRQSFQLAGVRINPASLAGEATVKRLQLNQDHRLRERTSLAEIGRYPTIEALARMND